MDRHEAEPIGEILGQYLKISQLENQVFGEKIASMWQELLGDEITLETQRIILESGFLFVELKSPSLKADLMMKRTYIKNIFNKKLEKEIIKQVVIR
ncbi:MAG: DUF721 domain-containing protein [Bacteroidales bacterium]|nr:DUF721 domain-containing protein [Bacteroidales bacterium]